MKKYLFPIDALVVWCPTWPKNLGYICFTWLHSYLNNSKRYKMNENHNSRRKEICFSNQNSCPPTLVLQWQKPTLGPLRIAVKKSNHLFLWLRQMCKISRFRNMHNKRSVINCEEDKNYHTNYEGNCVLSFSFQTRLPSYALITQFSPRLKRHSTSLVFST